MKRTDRLHPTPLPNPACFYREDEKYPERVKLSYTNGQVKTYWPEVPQPAPNLISAKERKTAARTSNGYVFRPKRAAKGTLKKLAGKTLRRRSVEKDELFRRMKDVIAARESELETTERLLRDCVNELCYRCGRYENEHEGACRDCKWYAVKGGLSHDDARA